MQPLCYETSPQGFAEKVTDASWKEFSYSNSCQGSQDDAYCGETSTLQAVHGAPIFSSISSSVRELPMPSR